LIKTSSSSSRLHDLYRAAAARRAARLTGLVICFVLAVSLAPSPNRRVDDLDPPRDCRGDLDLVALDGATIALDLDTDWLGHR
jgi:hypothetical protein